MVKLVNKNYQTLQVLKISGHKLRKVLTSNCNRDLLSSILACILTVLNANIKLSDFNWNRHKSKIFLLSDNSVPLSAKKRIILMSGGFILPLIRAVLHNLTSPISIQEHKKFREIYLVSDDHFQNTIPSLKLQAIGMPSPTPKIQIVQINKDVLKD
jgi:hypothetical protein